MGIIKEYEDGFTIRKAESDDKEAVLDMDAFKGLDYIVTVYDHIITDPDYHGFVGELDKQVVAFAFVAISDEGQSALKGGIRIHQDFRGKGYLPRFIDPMEAYVTAQCPDVKQWRYTALLDEYQKKLTSEMKEAGVLKKLIKRNYTVIDISIASLKALQTDEAVQKLVKEYNVAKIQNIDPDQVPHCLLDPSTQTDLFPEERIIAFLFPHKSCKSGFQAIMHSPWFMQGTITPSVTDPNTTSSGTKVKAVSFISGGPCGVGSMMADVDLFMDGNLSDEEQEKTWKQHALGAFTRDWSTYDAKLTLGLVFFTQDFVDSDKLTTWVLKNIPGTHQIYRDYNEPTDHIMVEYDNAKWMTYKSTKAS